MADRTVAPVDEERTAIGPEQYVGVVDLLVDDRLGDPKRGERPAGIGELRAQGQQAPVFVGREPTGAAEAQRLGLIEERLELRRKGRQSPVGGSDGQERAGAFDGVDLERRVAPQNRLPAQEIGREVDHRSQGIAGVSQQEPAALRFDRQRADHKIRLTLGQGGGQRPFEEQGGCGRLEVDDSGRCLDSPEGRPGTPVEYFQRPGGRPAEPFEFAQRPAGGRFIQPDSTQGRWVGFTGSGVTTVPLARMGW